MGHIVHLHMLQARVYVVRTLTVATNALPFSQASIGIPRALCLVWGDFFRGLQTHATRTSTPPASDTE
jgi:hypothetical protein